jgi:hypothetical protein
MDAETKQVSIISVAVVLACCVFTFGGVKCYRDGSVTDRVRLEVERARDQARIECSKTTGKPLECGVAFK